MEITNDEVNLLKEAVDHYRKRLEGYAKDVDLPNQLQKRAQLLSWELEGETQKIIQAIQETRLPPSYSHDINLRAYPVDMFEEALEQYEEGLSEIKRYVPVGLRKQIEKK